MYDDLGSLAEKLKMPGISFQEMTEDGETMQAVTTTAEAPCISNEMQESTIAVRPAANCKETRNDSDLADIPADTHSWPKNKPVPVAAPESFATQARCILDSVATISRPPEVEIRERNPVRLDMLFTVIGK